MNKIIQINLAGQAISIDEKAYETLSKYLRSLEAHFNSTDSGTEIIDDIEARIAELFLDQLKGEKAFVDQIMVDETIALMGTPFEMGYDEEGTTNSNSSSSTSTSSEKKLYRNTDDRILGGVSSGIAAYINMDVSLARILIFLIIVFTWVPFLLYILAWILIPAANTPEEKARMRGSRFNVNDIASGIRNEAENVADNLKKNEGLNNGLKSVGSLFERFIRFFSKLFGAGALIFLTVIGTAVAVAVIAHVSQTQINIFDHQVTAPLLFESNTLNWIFNTSLLAIILIPIVLVCYGIIIFIFDMKHSVNLKATFIAWLLSLAVFIGVSVFGASKVDVKGIEDFGNKMEKIFDENRDRYHNNYDTWEKNDSTILLDTAIGHS